MSPSNDSGNWPGHAYLFIYTSSVPGSLLGDRRISEYLIHFFRAYVHPGSESRVCATLSRSEKDECGFIKFAWCIVTTGLPLGLRGSAANAIPPRGIVFARIHQSARAADRVARPEHRGSAAKSKPQRVFDFTRIQSVIRGAPSTTRPSRATHRSAANSKVHRTLRIHPNT